MRMMMMVRMETDAANRAIADSSVGALMESTLQRLKPEAAYFGTVDGLRTAFLVFDLEHESQIVEVAEPLFHALNAKIDLQPVMNADDVTAGLQAWGESR